MSDVAIKVDDIYKQYRLGLIGSGTLQADIQSWWARLRGKEDPNSVIGSERTFSKKTFMALNGVSFEVQKGDALGIIGANGAGKSTLLKILSRVTTPTKGKAYIDGRISSMLEVGTGFNPELTGRENIYMNGAILGMNRQEVTRKLDEIITFSECERFIDTPVKRYSSGMYVKLAFSVAAHLDSEILIMDEVLAVGDMKFQQKCLDKMGNVAHNEGRTILYVSHNMSTIRQLCNRCIMLKSGQVLYDGNTEEAISRYLDLGDNQLVNSKSLIEAPRYLYSTGNQGTNFLSMEILGKKSAIFDLNEVMNIHLRWISDIKIEKTSIRFVFRNESNNAVASSMLMNFGETHIGDDNEGTFSVDLSQLAAGRYTVTLVLLEETSMGMSAEHDVVLPAFSIEKIGTKDLVWNNSQWGNVRLSDAVYIPKKN